MRTKNIFGHSISLLSLIGVLLCLTGCVHLDRRDWCFSELNEVVEKSDIPVKKIVAIRILGDSSLEVITKEGGPLGGGGVYIELEKHSGRWRIIKSESYDD